MSKENKVTLMVDTESKKIEGKKPMDFLETMADRIFAETEAIPSMISCFWDEVEYHFDDDNRMKMFIKYMQDKGEDSPNTNSNPSLFLEFVSHGENFPSGISPSFTSSVYEPNASGEL